jgi:peptide/nickel transport system substrate-binding protein
VREPDAARRQELLQAMHKRLWEIVPYVPLGQFKQPFLWRSNVTGVLKTNTLVYWNIEKA